MITISHNIKIQHNIELWQNIFHTSKETLKILIIKILSNVPFFNAFVTKHTTVYAFDCFLPLTHT